MERRSIDRPLTLWLLGATVGVGIILGSIFGMYGMTGVGLLLVPLARRDAGQWSVAGALTMFGAVWSFLLWSESNSGGVLDDATFWTIVGIVPLVAGVVVTVLLIRAGQHRTAAHS